MAARCRRRRHRLLHVAAVVPAQARSGGGEHRERRITGARPHAGQAALARGHCRRSFCSHQKADRYTKSPNSHGDNVYPIDLEVLSLAQAEHRYYSEFPLRHARDNVLSDALAVSSYSSVTLRHRFGLAERRETIFIFLRETLLPEVPALARSHFLDYNDHSPDLLENRTYLEFSGEHIRVRVRQDSLGAYIDLDVSQPVFDVVYVCGPLVFVSTHRPSAEQADAIVAGLQGCGISAGLNYKPYRIWSEEQLNAAAQRRYNPPHGLIETKPFEPNADWRALLGFPSYL